ncbi:MAG: hypothetical protein E7266_07025 [Lachnospiraceae bacterium]|nr:hypothetical protein [Lachnospiraceae bacterium]
MDKKKIFYGIIAVVVAFIAIQTIIDINKEKNGETESVSEDSHGSSNGQISSVSPDTDVKEAEIKSKIEELRELYPDGRFWNHMDIDEDEYDENKNYVTDKACNHTKNSTKYCNTYKGKSSDAYPYAVAGRQSVGFASMLSDYVFGTEVEAYSFSDYEKLRIGDQARVDGDTQTVFVIDKTDDYIEVVEVNNNGTNCRISWGRRITKAELADAFYISRY